jgi:hypothetical protein
VDWAKAKIEQRLEKKKRQRLEKSNGWEKKVKLSN